MSRRARIYQAAALAWAVSIVPAILWWQDSVLFVIVASVWANAVAGVIAAEAANDRTVLDRLDRIEALLKEAPRPVMPSCSRPPAGWWCSLADGHRGPCPARPRNLRARLARHR